MKHWKPVSYPSMSPYLICHDAEKLISFLEAAFDGTVQRRFDRPDRSGDTERWSMLVTQHREQCADSAHAELKKLRHGELEQGGYGHDEPERQRPPGETHRTSIGFPIRSGRGNSEPYGSE
ncbi:hypothetical protein [Enteractinococcus coprophilus]|uniref:Uncharacterized protein n=1 Tax=Enteractinococcus coprophilus TaxID=1027633 RepID=A0A543AJ42_9MICC|nr:hypothetical protein [Enteractinococcus coprophilus]TQL72536.1 hypothetical protein FB556_1195 [Enteractinococcus coprophilus]